MYPTENFFTERENICAVEGLGKAENEPKQQVTEQPTEVAEADNQQVTEQPTEVNQQVAGQSTRPTEEALRDDYNPIVEREVAEFLPSDYSIVAAALTEAIGDKGFVAATIETSHPYFFAKLVATLIIYRDAEGEVTNVVPVWWEMHTYDEDGIERLNDFSFATLRPQLIDRRPTTAA